MVSTGASLVLLHDALNIIIGEEPGFGGPVCTVTFFPVLDIGGITGNEVYDHITTSNMKWGEV